MGGGLEKNSVMDCPSIVLQICPLCMKSTNQSSICGWYLHTAGLSGNLGRRGVKRTEGEEKVLVRLDILARQCTVWNL